MSKEEKSPFHIRLLYVTTIGLILSNVLTLVLANLMVSGVTQSIYDSGNMLNPPNTQARTPLQLDDQPNNSSGGGGGTVGGSSCPFNSKPPVLNASNFTCEGGTRTSCQNKCVDVYVSCIGTHCYKYPQGSDDAYVCLTNWGEFYSSCMSLCTQVCATSGGGDTRPRVE